MADEMTVGDVRRALWAWAKVIRCRISDHNWEPQRDTKVEGTKIIRSSWRVCRRCGFEDVKMVHEEERTIEKMVDTKRKPPTTQVPKPTDLFDALTRARFEAGLQRRNTFIGDVMGQASSAAPSTRCPYCGR